MGLSWDDSIEFIAKECLLIAQTVISVFEQLVSIKNNLDLLKIHLHKNVTKETLSFLKPETQSDNWVKQQSSGLTNNKSQANKGVNVTADRGM